jgi:hypothetical protein
MRRFVIFLSFPANAKKSSLRLVFHPSKSLSSFIVIRLYATVTEVSILEMNLYVYMPSASVGHILYDAVNIGSVFTYCYVCM